MQRATVLLSEIEANNLNQEEDSNQLVVWSVTVPKKKSIISQSALGEKQVCLTLDTVGNNIQIAEWPSAGEAIRMANPRPLSRAHTRQSAQAAFTRARCSPRTARPSAGDAMRMANPHPLDPAATNPAGSLHPARAWKSGPAQFRPENLAHRPRKSHPECAT